MNGIERSDLACEFVGTKAPQNEGIEWKTREAAGFQIGELIIGTKAAAQSLGKPCGRYLTVECGRIDRLSSGDSRALAHLLAGELRGTVAQRRSQLRAVSASITRMTSGCVAFTAPRKSSDVSIPV